MNLKLWFDSTYCVPQFRGVRLFTIQGEMFMSIRIQNSDRKIAKTANATAGITSGRSDLLLLGNKVVSVQKNGNEFRTHCADSTLKKFADSIYSMLQSKEILRVNELADLCEKLAAQNTRKPRAKRLNFAQRIAKMNETRDRKLQVA